jgi:hypothetical protein
MNSNLIVMLTHNDQTVHNAIQIFDECKDMPVTCWGFKDIGIAVDEMKTLVENMKNAGKTTFLEVVSYSEEECMAGAKLAVELGFDYLLGTLYYESVFQYIKEHSIQYMPFCGKIHGNPSILEGSIQEIIDDAKSMIQKGIKGFDLLAYRNVDDEKLARQFCKQINVPVVIAGSINSLNRIDIMAEINPWGFTMGGALFEGKYESNAPFKKNLEVVVEYMADITKESIKSNKL